RMRSMPPMAVAACMTTARAASSWASARVAGRARQSSTAERNSLFMRASTRDGGDAAGLFRRSRALPALFEEFFPVLCPGPAEEVDEAFVQRRQLRGTTVRSKYDAAFNATLDEVVAALRIDATGAR